MSKRAGARPLRSPVDLAAAGVIAAEAAEALSAVADRYAVAVTPAMAALIDPSDPDDPIARQFVPDARELTASAGESPDPIGDRPHTPISGVVHRYPDRVLLKVTHTCPVYCRFCFRREMVGPDGDAPLTAQALEAACVYIAGDAGIREVILTGGDPLVLSPRRVADITRRLDGIGHLAVIRWHSRVPVVDPDRVDAAMIAALGSASKAVYIGIHANHPRELTAAARAAIARLGNAGIALVSQTVLLKGVNDDAETLAELFQAFVALKVRPYYLHHLDAAPGTAHFRVPLAQGQAIMGSLRGRISGLALPTYVVDIPGGYGKVPVGPQHVCAADDGSVEIVDAAGRRHRYRAD